MVVAGGTARIGLQVGLGIGEEAVEAPEVVHRTVVLRTAGEHADQATVRAAGKQAGAAAAAH